MKWSGWRWLMRTAESSLGSNAAGEAREVALAEVEDKSLVDGPNEIRRPYASGYVAVRGAGTDDV
jgi:hypothetical protein